MTARIEMTSHCSFNWTVEGIGGVLTEHEGRENTLNEAIRQAALKGATKFRMVSTFPMNIPIGLLPDRS